MTTRIHSLLFCFILILISISHGAAQDCDPWAAKIVSIQGKVEVKKNGATHWDNVKLDETFCKGDHLRVLDNSRAAIVLQNQAVARLDQKTFITFTGVENKKVSLIDLIKGAVHFFSRVPRSLKVMTPFVNGAVEGTEFFIKVDDDQTLLSVFRGRVLASNENGSLSLGNHQAVIARADKAPKSIVIVSPRDAVKWALFYPSIQDYQVEYLTKALKSDLHKMIQESVKMCRDGNVTGAIACLENAPNDIRDPQWFTYRASLLLSVGREDDAGNDIAQALGLDSKNSHASALKSVMAVAQNKKDEALELSEKAVRLDPTSATAKIALSYAQQAHFQIQGALESLQQAVAISPKNALAWGRLAELWMAVGDLDKALETAQKAALLNPNLEKTQTVLGFAYLAQIKTKDAKTAFEKAILLDQAAPMPRLGLGLAMIREGDLKPGRAEIEIAAGLSPNDALIRSYLGKAFFDEKRDKQSNSQLTIAKEMDPQDPTPWFYDAIRKQTLNRPVEALQDLQKSIELNDNRAVYRSRLLLDQDLAARSAGLSRIYEDLGFEQAALAEAWKSLNANPTSHSAHRFLADSYAALPRHEIARVSELLQSQLLQPINITPVQPHLAESATFINEGAGPADSSFNEFNPLFLRNRLALQTSGVMGGNNIYGEELVHSAVWDNISYSVGQFHYETDGFRKNNDLDLDIYNAFLQTSLSHKTSVQFEYRYKETKNGDLAIRFDPDEFSLTWRENSSYHTVRAGMHHAISNQSDLIISLIYRSINEGFSNLLPTGKTTLAEDADGYIGEIQHIFSSDWFHINTGAGYISQNSQHTTKIPAIPFSPPIPSQTITDRQNIDHSNLYSYVLIDMLKNCTWTIGLSRDFYEGGLKDRNQFNPKFGVTFTPAPGTTLRGAVFRTFQRTLPTSQTIEPTQVAGFNQFYEKRPGSDAWTYGVGIDQSFSPFIHAGVEFSKQKQDFPFIFSTPLGQQKNRATWRDYLGRLYLYWTPHPNLALNAEYQFEDFDRPEDALGDGMEVDLQTHRFPIEIRYFHPSGFSWIMRTTYLNQDGVFGEYIPPPTDSFIYASDKDQSWIFDASVNYRLKKRRGLVSLEARNLFDKEIQYQDTDPSNPRIAPERLLTVKFTIAF